MSNLDLGNCDKLMMGSASASTPQAKPATEKNCGTCRLWGDNFYKSHSWKYMCSGDCAADVVMDVPASWKSNAGMAAADGADCPAWQEITP